MDVNLSKLMAGGQPTAEDLHKELLQSAWKDYVRKLLYIRLYSNSVAMAVFYKFSDGNQ